jgi:IS4 transposase
MHSLTYRGPKFWKVTLFFRWIKQHLRLRGFFSNDPNGVRVQVWTAICAYLLVAIAKKENALPRRHRDRLLPERRQMWVIESPR